MNVHKTLTYLQARGVPQELGRCQEIPAQVVVQIKSRIEVTTVNEKVQVTSTGGTPCGIGVHWVLP
jgi:hypothetical protein